MLLLSSWHSCAYRAYEIEWRCTHFFESACRVHWKCLYKPLRACTSLASPATTVGLGRETHRSLWVSLAWATTVSTPGPVVAFLSCKYRLARKKYRRCTVARVLVTILILCPTMAVRSDSRVNHSSPHSSAHVQPRRAAAAELFRWSTCRKLVWAYTNICTIFCIIVVSM